VFFIDRPDRGIRKAAMKAIREAEWFGANAPLVRVSPHPTNGLGL
jgi:peptide deformylase